MLLIIDIGNTCTKFHIYQKELSNFKTLHSFKLETRLIINLKKEVIIGFFLKKLKSFKLNPENIKKIAICSTSSSAFKKLNKVLKTVFKNAKYLVISARLKTEINFLVKNLNEIGADLVALSAGSINIIKEHKKPCIAVCLGTASTFSLIDENFNFLGVSIAPGLKTSALALITNTDLLKIKNLKLPKSVIHTNTNECVLSGSLLGHASLVDGMCKRIETELKKACTVILTGGNAPLIKKAISTKFLYIEDLLQKGTINICMLNNFCC